MKKLKKVLLVACGLVFTSCSFNIIASNDSNTSNTSVNQETSNGGTTNSVVDVTTSSNGDSSTSNQTTSSEDKNTSSEGLSTQAAPTTFENSSSHTTSQGSTNSTNSTTSQSSASSSSQNTTSSQSTSTTSSNSTTSSHTTSTSSSSSSSEPSKPAEVNAKITKYGTIGEGAYAEWSDIDGNNARVEYKLTSESTYKEIDNELVRQKDSSTARFDALGLKAGVYDFKITTANSEVLEMKNINVTNYDRSGYAHFKTTNAVGGYNNDGTVKANATIVYVTDSTKNTVEAKIGSKTYKGLSAILQAQSSSSNPLIVRLIGSINAATWNQITYTKGKNNLTVDQIKDKNGKALPQQSFTEEEIISGGHNTLNTSTYTKLNGLSNRIKYDEKKKEFDSYYNMLDISGAKNVTVEGVGEDAKIFQWGFTWKNCSYIEVRNITFDDYPEDACAFEGPDDATTLSGFTTGHIWLHNNTFNEGKNYWDVCPEQDKHEGDGATDLKKNANITFSYNHYFKNHKTGLVGGGDAQHTANITFHHNFYDQCSSRLPLGRQANMHMYNNYYYKSSSYSMSIRAGAYAFVEACNFESGKNPMETKDGDGKKGVIKSYNNVITASGTNNSVKATSRDQKVANDNIYDKNFDTNPTNFYYDSTNKVSDVAYLTDANQAKIDAKAYAGPCKINPTEKGSSSNPTTPTNPDKPDVPVEPTGEEEVFNVATLGKADGQYTSSFSNGIFTVHAGNGTNEFVDIANGVAYYSSLNSAYTSELKLRGAGSKTIRSVEFTLTKAATIKIYARSANSSQSRQLAIYDSSYSAIKTFDPILSATELTYNVSAGTYYVGCASSGLNLAAIVVAYTK